MRNERGLEKNWKKNILYLFDDDIYLHLFYIDYTVVREEEHDTDCCTNNTVKQGKRKKDQIKPKIERYQRNKT